MASVSRNGVSRSFFARMQGMAHGPADVAWERSVTGSSAVTGHRERYRNRTASALSPIVGGSWPSEPSGSPGKRHLDAISASLEPSPRVLAAETARSRNASHTTRDFQVAR